MFKKTSQDVIDAQADRTSKESSWWPEEAAGNDSSEMTFKGRTIEECPQILIRIKIQVWRSRSKSNKDELYYSTVKQEVIHEKEM